MKTIIVDDEQMMIKSFRRLSEGIPGINIVGGFSDSADALDYASRNDVELVILDIAMPRMTGIELARKLREIRPDILICFITAYDNYIRESNELGADYYIVKPYKRDVIEKMAERMMILAQRLRKKIYIQTFGRFVVFKDGNPVPLRGKAKEILALVVAKRGKEISNGECYSTIWEHRPYDNISMKVYYNAIRRLKEALAENCLSDLLISTTRGLMVNTDLFDCDYYFQLDKNPSSRDKFEGEFMSEYSWGEYYIGELLERNNW